MAATPHDTPQGALPECLAMGGMAMNRLWVARAWWAIALLGGVLGSGCMMVPQLAHQPVVRNPFPELSRVAVAPFFNLSTERTVDGRQFAIAYYNELQLVPGFEVVPVGVAEAAIVDYGLSMDDPRDAQRLAQILGVDAVVIGAVTDYSPYYPPRCTLLVEWYAADPRIDTIPPGYGLPWGTPEAEQIPEALVFEAEFAQARAAWQSRRGWPPAAGARGAAPSGGISPNPGDGGPSRDETPPSEGVHTPPQPAGAPSAGRTAAWSGARSARPTTGSTVPPRESLPAPAAQVSPGDGALPAVPVLRHIAAYNGHDPQFSEALSTYYFFRDDARFGGREGYLQRPDDFIRFCCHLHVFQMLSARGGAGDSLVVWRWPESR
jgi:hypothetical protein